jgi:hypothetical protein
MWKNVRADQVSAGDVVSFGRAVRVCSATVYNPSAVRIMTDDLLVWICQNDSLILRREDQGAREDA